jgi:uncharacterized protein YciI
MLFLIHCTDKPNSAQVRADTRPKHLAYLEGSKVTWVFAGPVLADDGTTAKGSLLIGDFPDLAAAKAFAQHDPYAIAGLFEQVTVSPTRKVFPA